MRKLEGEARKRGEPLTLSELATNYPAIPDGENAAIALMEIWEKDEPEYWQAFRAGTRPLSQRKNVEWDPILPVVGVEVRNQPRTTAYSPESIAVAESFLGSNHVRMAAVQRVLMERPKVRFPVKFTDGLAALMPHVAQLRTESQAVRVAAALAIEKGNAWDAIAKLEEQVRLADALKDGPFLIEHLVRLSIHMGVISDMERLLTRLPVGAGELAGLESIARSLEMSEAFRRTMIEERATCLSTFELSDSAVQQLFETTDDPNEKAPSPEFLRAALRAVNLTGVLSADRRLMLETMGQVIALSETNNAESLVAIEGTFAEMDAKARQFPPKIFCGLLLPALGKGAAKFASMEARRRCALTAIAVEKYRLEHRSQLPEQLSELVPKYLAQVPEDPFVAHLLRFRKLAKGFVVYSVGPDREDQQGRERGDKRAAGAFDEAFGLER